LTSIFSKNIIVVHHR